MFSEYFPDAERMFQKLTHKSMPEWGAAIRENRPVYEDDFCALTPDEAMEALESEGLILPNNNNTYLFECHRSCDKCGGGGFSGHGQCYEDVCDDCAGNPRWVEWDSVPSDLVGVISWASYGKQKISTIIEMTRELIGNKRLSPEWAFSVGRHYDGEKRKFTQETPRELDIPLVHDMIRLGAVPCVGPEGLVVTLRRMPLFLRRVTERNTIAASTATERITDVNF